MIKFNRGFPDDENLSVGTYKTYFRSENESLANAARTQKSQTADSTNFNEIAQNDIQNNNFFPMKYGGELEKSVCSEDVLKIIENTQNTQNLISAFESYLPKSDIIVIADLKKDESTKIKRYKDCVYFGPFINSKRHGRGIINLL